MKLPVSHQLPSPRCDEPRQGALSKGRALGGWPGLALALLGAGLLFPQRLRAEEGPIPVIDLHVDLPYRSLYKQKPFEQGSGEYVAKELVRAGVRGLVLPLYLPLDATPEGRTQAELERSYAHVFGAILRTPPYAVPGCNIHAAGTERREVSTWLAFEGAGQFAGDEGQLKKWMLRGVRSFGLVHAQENELATSSGDAGSPSRGLTVAGRKFVETVLQLGGLVDVSHASDAATNEAIKLALDSNQPIIATHSNARALAPHPRNLSDEQIRKIAASGGVIGVNFHQRFLSPNGGRSATLKDVVRQVLYLKKKGGLSAVAIGSDFEGGITPVAELSSASKFQVLAQALLDAGLSRSEVRQIFYDNARRVLCRATP